MAGKWLKLFQWLLIAGFTVALFMQLRAYAKYESLNSQYWQQVLQLERHAQERGQINQRYRELVDQMERENRDIIQEIHKFLDRLEYAE